MAPIARIDVAVRTVLALVACALLAGCIPRADRPAPGVRSAAPDAAAVRQCHADLTGQGVRFRVLPDRSFDGGCSALGAVQLTDIGTPVPGLAAMTCPLAARFARWVRDDVQAAARQWLGQPVVRIESLGTYACRPVNNQAGARLSEHGRANAVDIAAFVMADGRRITVLAGWADPDDRVRGFLREVQRRGCRRFAVGLGPDANALHRDHFHFDLGRGPYCR